MFLNCLTYFIDNRYTATNVRRKYRECKREREREEGEGEVERVNSNSHRKTVS